MAQVRGTFSALYDNVDKVVFSGLNQYLKEMPPIWRGYYNVKTSDRRLEIMQGVTGMGDVPEKPEGEAYALDFIRPGYQKQLIHTEFGLGFEVTETALDDDQFDQLDKSSMWLAFSARTVEEKRAAAIFNNGFSTETAWDGVSVFSSSHTLAGGGTARNILATAADLSATSLTQALVDLQNQTKLDSGQLVAPVTGLTLLIPPDYEFLAERIIRSTQLAQSADNDVNALRTRRTWNIVINPYLTDSDAWFVLASNTKQHGITSYTRTGIYAPPRMVDARTGNLIYKVRFRRSWGVSWWQNIFASPGA